MNFLKSDLDKISINNLFKRYKKSELSPVEVTKFYLDKIKASQKDLNSFITISEEFAIKKAIESEKRYLSHTPISIMDGIPYAAKDLIFTKSILTTMGCKYYKNFIPEKDAKCIESMNNSGAILLGKTNTQQFAMGATGYNSYYGSVHNPNNLSKISGGSSSGSAAAVAAGLCPLALATDTGGSTRLPATLCGCVGMKPTYARISTRGVYPASITFDTVGLISSNVIDNATALGFLAEYDDEALFSPNLPKEDYTRDIQNSLKGTIIHVPYEIITSQTDPEIEANFMKSLDILSKEGAIIREMKFPDLSEYRKLRTLILFAEAYCEHKKLYAEHPEVYDSGVASDLEKGKLITADEYISYQCEIKKFRNLFRDMCKNINIIAYPSCPITAPDINHSNNVLANGKPTNIYEALSRFNWFGSTSGYPAITIPNGNSNNLPTGIQFLAKEYEESKLYNIAYQLEQAMTNI